MAASTSQLTAKHDVLLFGPQFLSFTAESLAQLRAHCLESALLKEWVLRIVAELPLHWETIVPEFPSLKKLPGKQQLQDVAQCIHTGKPAATPFPFPNLLLCPLVVILQLKQYMRYRELVQPESEQGRFSDTDIESVGFCTGLLSASAVSCSTTQEQLEKHGATAVRLAILIGAVVDAGNADADPGSESISLSAAWQTGSGRTELDRVLETFPKVQRPLSLAFSG